MKDFRENLASVFQSHQLNRMKLSGRNQFKFHRLTMKWKKKLAAFNWSHQIRKSRIKRPAINPIQWLSTWIKGQKCQTACEVAPALPNRQNGRPPSAHFPPAIHQLPLCWQNERQPGREVNKSNRMPAGRWWAGSRHLVPAALDRWRWRTPNETNERNHRLTCITYKSKQN